MSCQSLSSFELKFSAISKAESPAAFLERVEISAHSAAFKTSSFFATILTPIFADTSTIGFPSVSDPLLVVTIITPFAAREP